VYTAQVAGVKQGWVRFVAIVGLVLLVRFAMVSRCARIGKDVGADYRYGRF